MSEQEFRAMCQRHDLTYNYSDDIRSFRSGNESEKAIREAAKSLPAGVAARIWNEVVDAKILDGHRQYFYWREAA